MGKGVVDHQVVDMLVVMPASANARDAERARGGEIRHLAVHRGLDTLAGAEQARQAEKPQIPGAAA
jgi:hypothetical protein